MIAVQVARLVANYSLFLDAVDEELLHPDVAVQMMEVLGADLQALDKGFLRELIDAFAIVADEMDDPDVRELIRTIPHGYYLEETIAEGDPVRLAELETLREAEEQYLRPASPAARWAPPVMSVLNPRTTGPVSPTASGPPGRNWPHPSRRPRGGRS